MHHLFVSGCKFECYHSVIVFAAASFLCLFFQRPSWLLIAPERRMSDGAFLYKEVIPLPD
jgi:hypothetical protein